MYSKQAEPSSQRHLGFKINAHQQWLDILNNSAYITANYDFYNQGELVEKLEKRVCSLLNMPAALFFPKGTQAQLCLLKVVADAKNDCHFACHPQSHIAFDEQNAYQDLMQLEQLDLGSPWQVTSLNDLKALPVSVGSVVIELPLRRAGFLLPEFEELRLISNYCRENQIHLHLDGARLLESSAYYQKPASEITALFDSVYISLYKGLCGLGGAVLLASPSMIEASKPWRSRMGGDLYSAFPMLVTALEELDNKAPKIPELVHRASEIARLLKGKFSQSPEKLSVQTQQTNGFLIKLRGSVSDLTERSKQLNEKYQLKLFSNIFATDEPSSSLIEIQVGHDHQQISNNEILNYFSDLTATQ